MSSPWTLGDFNELSDFVLKTIQREAFPMSQTYMKYTCMCSIHKIHSSAPTDRHCDLKSRIFLIESLSTRPFAL